MRECECGCGAKVNNRFLPGHDARLKARLIGEALDAPSGVVRRAAERRLKKLGWTPHLEAARERREQAVA